jgi:MFS family permease
MLATIIALVLVDRVGRKPLLYAGLAGMTVCLILLAYSFHSPAAFGAAPGMVATICLMVYITCFAFSMGPIAWILVSEVFPLRVRGRGVAAASLGSGASNFLVSMTFLSLINAAGSSMTFLIYAAFCVFTVLFVRFIVPETRGRELETISSEANAAKPRVNEQGTFDHV